MTYLQMRKLTPYQMTGMTLAAMKKRLCLAAMLAVNELSQLSEVDELSQLSEVDELEDINKCPTSCFECCLT